MEISNLSLKILKTLSEINSNKVLHSLAIQSLIDYMAGFAQKLRY